MDVFYPIKVFSFDCKIKKKKFKSRQRNVNPTSIQVVTLGVRGLIQALLCDTWRRRGFENR